MATLSMRLQMYLIYTDLLLPKNRTKRTGPRFHTVRLHKYMRKNSTTYSLPIHRATFEIREHRWEEMLNMEKVS